MNKQEVIRITGETNAPPRFTRATLRKRQFKKILSTIKKFRFNSGPYTPLLIMASPRTGSNLLQRLVGQHPDIVLLGEMMNAGQGHLIARMLKGRPCGKWLRFQIEHATPRGEPPALYRGGKFMLPHLYEVGLTPEMIHELFPDARYLFLSREDLYERFLSMAIGWTRGRWTQTVIDEWVPPKMHIEPERLLRFFKWYQQLTAQWYEGLPKENMLVIDHDNYIASPDTFVQKEVFPWLGLPDEELVVTTVKQNRWGSSMVVNEDELAQLLNSPLRYVRPGQPVDISAA